MKHESEQIRSAPILFAYELYAAIASSSFDGVIGFDWMGCYEAGCFQAFGDNLILLGQSGLYRCCAPLRKIAIVFVAADGVGVSFYAQFPVRMLRHYFRNFIENGSCLGSKDIAAEIEVEVVDLRTSILLQLLRKFALALLRLIPIDARDLRVPACRRSDGKDERDLRVIQKQKLPCAV